MKRAGPSDPAEGDPALAHSKLRYPRLAPCSFAPSLLAAAGAVGSPSCFVWTGPVSGLLRAHLGERILPVDPWGPIRFSILTDAFGIRLGVACI